MKTVLLLLISIALFCDAPNLYSQQFEWVANQRGNNTIRAVAVTTDTWDDVLLTGFFRDSIDVDPDMGKKFMLYSNGGYNIYFVRYSGKGKLLSAFSIGGSGNDIGRQLMVDDFDNFYIGGYFSSTVDFDPDTSSQNLKFI
jgi:hypothetical protein